MSEDQSLNIWNNSRIYSHGPILLDCMYIVYVQSIFSAAIQNFGLKFSWNIFYSSLNIGKKFVFLVICRITKVSSFDMYSPSKLKIWHRSSVNPLITLSIPAVRLTCIACFSTISQSILNRFWWNLARPIFESRGDYLEIFIGKYCLAEKLDHLACKAKKRTLF